MDNELDIKLNELNQNFDSTLYYLDKFKASIDKYPMGNYKINYSLNPIPIYRLNGLTPSHFLSSNIKLWDFRSWTKSFRDTQNSDVAFLYKSAEEVNTTNKKYIAQLMKGNISGISSNYMVNPAIVNKMLKYDFNSATASLLSYQEAKINLLRENADNKNDGSLFALNKFSKSPDYYFAFIQQAQKVKNLLKIAQTKATPEAIKKYNTFFTENYTDIDDYKAYLNKETTTNDSVFYTAMNSYKNKILQSYIPTDETDKLINYKDGIIRIRIITPDMIEGVGYYIHSKSLVPNKQTFITGTHANGKIQSAFAALVDSSNNVQWLKEFNQGAGIKHGLLSAVLNDGFAMIVSTADDDKTKNDLYILEYDGNTKSTKTLPYSSVPHELIFDDIASTYLVAFKGATYAPYKITTDSLQLCMLNTDLSTMWSKSLLFTGYLANIIKTNDMFYIYGAFNKITDAKGTEHAVKDGKINSFAYCIDPKGNWHDLKEFNTSFSHYPLLVSKINNEYMDMIAIKDLQPETLITHKRVNNNNDPVYMVITPDNKIYYQYIKE